jgi:hypothetical protein
MRDTVGSLTNSSGLTVIGGNTNGVTPAGSFSIRASRAAASAQAWEMKHFAGRATSSLHEGYNAASQRRERPAGDRRCGWLLCSVRSRRRVPAFRRPSYMNREAGQPLFA